MARQPVTTRLDLAVACAVAALGVAEATVPFSTVTGEGSPWVAGTLAGLAGLAGLTLAVRRRYVQTTRGRRGNRRSVTPCVSLHLTAFGWVRPGSATPA